jgi:hypothetical protein
MIDKLKTTNEITFEKGVCCSDERTDAIVGKINEIIDIINNFENALEMMTNIEE